jgi:ABC-2 type transport system ATP-binding protein
MPVITATNLTKIRGGTRALDGIDLEIQAGEIVAVLGPNGAGKTTMFELILGLTPPTDGTVSVFGQPPGSPGVRTRVGAMLQDAGLPDNFTGGELVRIVARAHRRPLDIEAVLAQVGLDGRHDRAVGKLSGGERQRVLLAMALIGDPDLLLLDEPTAPMDPDARRRFWQQANRAVAGGMTLVFATHDLAEAARIANRVVVLVDGKAAADAPMEAFGPRHGPGFEDVYLAAVDRAREALA